MFKKGQIWIETVIYALIGLAIISILLSLIKPTIEEKKDMIILKASKEMMGVIENTIEDVEYYGVGNSRLVEIKIEKGKLLMDGKNDKIVFLMESNAMYSEPGQEIREVGSRIKIFTKKKTRKYEVNLTLDYSDLNITWNGKDIKQILQPSPTSYKIKITNYGKEGSQKTRIDLS